MVLSMTKKILGVAGLLAITTGQFEAFGSDGGHNQDELTLGARMAMRTRAVLESRAQAQTQAHAQAQVRAENEARAQAQAELKARNAARAQVRAENEAIAQAQVRAENEVDLQSTDNQKAVAPSRAPEQQLARLATAMLPTLQPVDELLEQVAANYAKHISELQITDNELLELLAINQAQHISELQSSDNKKAVVEGMKTTTKTTTKTSTWKITTTTTRTTTNTTTKTITSAFSKVSPAVVRSSRVDHREPATRAPIKNIYDDGYGGGYVTNGSWGGCRGLPIDWNPNYYNADTAKYKKENNAELLKALSDGKPLFY